MNRVAIGLDVGGTKIAGGLITSRGDTLHHETVPTPRGDTGADPGAAATAGLAADLLAQARRMELAVCGAGIGVPEYVDPCGRVTSSEVLAWGADQPLGEDWCGGPVVVDSDVRCAARAEQLLGHGRDLASFVFVSIGTGISHTFVRDGELWAGQRGRALALGELPVDPAAAISETAPLTVEQQASGGAIERLLAATPGSTPSTDDLAVRAGHVVGGALTVAVNILDPSAVVVGGGLGTSAGPFVEAMKRRYEELNAGRPAPPPLLVSQLGDQGGVVGAGLLAQQAQPEDQRR